MSTMNAHCPICDGQIQILEDTEETEVLVCSDCHNRVVVERIDDNDVVLVEAPEVEEDWGE